MRTQFDMMLAEHAVPESRNHHRSTALGLLVIFLALSPLCAVCGFMLAQILQLVPY